MQVSWAFFNVDLILCLTSYLLSAASGCQLFVEIHTYTHTHSDQKWVALLWNVLILPLGNSWGWIVKKNVGRVEKTHSLLVKNGDVQEPKTFPSSYQLFLRRGKVERTFLLPDPTWYKHCSCYESCSQYVGQGLERAGCAHLSRTIICL